MEPDTVIIRYGEIFLKSDWVRKSFTSSLINNIKTTLAGIGIDCKVHMKRHRIFLIPDQTEKAAYASSRVFGVKSASPAISCEPDDEAIFLAAESLFKNAKGSFCVRARRHKSHPVSSMEIESGLGARICERFKNRVDLKKPDTVVGVEVTPEKAYVFTSTLKGPGGLPYGTQGLIGARLNTGNDAVAAYLLMRRGCEAVAWGDKKLKRLLSEWTPRPIKSVSGPEHAIESKAMAICTGDGLKIQSTNTYSEYNVPVLRPLMGFEDKRVKEIWKLLSCERE